MSHPFSFRHLLASLLTLTLLLSPSLQSFAQTQSLSEKLGEHELILAEDGGVLLLFPKTIRALSASDYSFKVGIYAYDKDIRTFDLNIFDIYLYKHRVYEIVKINDIELPQKYRSLEKIEDESRFDHLYSFVYQDGSGFEPAISGKGMKLLRQVEAKLTHREGSSSSKSSKQEEEETKGSPLKAELSRSKIGAPRIIIANEDGVLYHYPKTIQKIAQNGHQLWISFYLPEPSEEAKLTYAKVNIFPDRTIQVLQTEDRILAEDEVETFTIAQGAPFHHLHRFFYEQDYTPTVMPEGKKWLRALEQNS